MKESRLLIQGGYGLQGCTRMHHQRTQPVCRVPVAAKRLQRSWPLLFKTRSGRLICIHLQCWEVLPFCRLQRQRCIKILCPKDPVFYIPLALKTAKGQLLPALEVYKTSRCGMACARGQRRSSIKTSLPRRLGLRPLETLVF